MTCETLGYLVAVLAVVVLVALGRLAGQVRDAREAVADLEALVEWHRRKADRLHTEVALLKAQGGATRRPPS